ncbi:MAG: LCP family protein [Oscillospiraceae bacterium]|nr:LCP family protein [Oscillospiraceae bacterium]
MSKRARIIFRVLYISLLVVVSITSFSIGAVFAYKDYLFSLPAYIPDNVEATMVNEEGSFVNISEVIAAETTVIPIPQYDHIHNILLIGIDSRSQTYSQSGSGSRADIIMVMSVDEKESSIKLLSIARDSYAFIPGFDDPEKINAAMAYGGPELLMATIEGALRIELDEYAFVNFYHMEKVIDTVGGVYVHVSEAERTADGGLNSLLSFDNLERNLDINTGLVAQSGTQRLYGRQAVMYSRIRYVGNGDYDRSNRQVEVLQSLLKQFTSISLKDQASTMEHILPHVATNISQDQIEWYAFSFLSKLESPEFVYKQLPIEGYFNQGMYSDVTPGQWSIRPDWNGMIPIVQEFIYGETFPVDPVPLIPKAPEMTVD